MKLHEHVALLKSAIENAYDKEFARLGFGRKSVMSMDQIPVENQKRRQRFEAMLESHIGETGDYEHGREKLVDELTFTLFNRLAAVKVMEAANLFPPIITRRAEHGGRSFGHKAWLESNPYQRNEELEGLRSYIKEAFDELGESLPLFSSNYPFSLFPDTINLNEIIDLFNAVERDSHLDDDIWKSDDILGWCYESYNNSKKKELKDSGAKIEYNYVSLQSQVYTPRWVVQFLVDNSLGKLYLEMFPDSRIKNQFKIANAPDSRERDLKSLHTIRIIDPACGSGNFLLYAFDLFYELYLDQIENYAADYLEADIPKLIIENNLHGIDLDDRAVQLAQLGLFIKASKRTRSRGEFKYSVVSSDFYLPDYPEVAHIFEATSDLGQKQRELIAEIWEDLQYAYKFGSLLRVKEKVEQRLHSLFSQQGGRNPNLFSEEELGVETRSVQTDAFFEQDVATEREFIAGFFANLRTAVDQYARSEKNAFMASKTQDAITFLELLTTEYDIATANPPYTDSSDFGPDLKKFVEDNYKKPFKFHTNLYATFIKRCYELSGGDGKVAMIHPRTFMFIKSFVDVRKFMLEKTHIDVFVDYSLSNLFGTIMVDPAFYVLEKDADGGRDALFMSLDQYTRTPNEKYKKKFCLQALDDYIKNVPNEHNYSIPQSKLKAIKFWPFIYWISDDFREKFEDQTIGDVADVALGLKTANNNKYLRFFWEVKNSDISIELNDKKKWVVYLKGGAYQKWVGNEWLVVEWENGGRNIKNQKNSQQIEKGHGFRAGVTLSTRSIKGVCGREFEANRLFDMAASSILYRNSTESLYWVAYSNSKLFNYVLNCLNPTVNKQPEDIRRLPGKVSNKCDQYASNCVSVGQHLVKNVLLSMSFNGSPITEQSIGKNIQSRLKSYFDQENHLLAQVLINEAIIDEIIFKSYDLTRNDIDMVLSKEGDSVGQLPVEPRASVAFLEEPLPVNVSNLESIREFVQSLPKKEFTSDERETIENEFGYMYQKNNELEDFCKRHQINPINVWFWFMHSNVVPKQRIQSMAMEFLVDLVREILMEDEDGIIPLVPNAGEKVLSDRVEEKFDAKGFNSAEYANFDSVLGRPISEYLSKDFFAELSDHLNLFMYLPKTPFIWHLSSGPDQGFDCYIIIYKWSRDNLMRLRSVYIENRERALVNRQTDLADSESASAQNEKDLIFRQLQEIESFKEKIDELLAEGYDPILDDGVGKNIAPLQKKGMIPYDVLNPGQLKKYLNADW